MSNKGYDSELLAELKNEERFVQERERGERRVKIERGQVWKVRFLPVHLGEKGTWFARVAKHWLFKKPITCPVETGEGFGGGKKDCACCRASQELNDSPDQQVSRFGWETRASSQWLTYCIVLEKDGVEITGNELLMPYEFAHYVSTWEELKHFWKTGSKGGKNLTSILDYHTGCDFSVTKTGKGLRLDREDARPIFDEDDPHFDSYIEKIESALKQPKVHIPTDKELQLFADKILEEGEKIGRGGGGPSRPSRRVVSDDELEGAEADAPPARRPLPPRRSVPTEDLEPAAEEDDSNPELNPQPKNGRSASDSEDDAPPRRRRSEPEPEPEDEDAPPPPRRHVAEQEEAPQRRRPAPEPEEEPAAEEDAPPPPKRQPPPLPKMPGPKRAAPIADKIDDDPEAVPEEATDSAPPAKTPVGKTRPAPPEEPEDTPPPTTRKLGSMMRDKIRSVSQRDS